MLHSKHITLTKGKSESTLTRTRFKVNRGLIFKVWITFPAGCAGLVKLRLITQGHAFLPVEPDAFIKGDNFVFEFPVYFEIFTEPQIITIEAWNEDTVYDHTIDIIMSIIPRKWVLPTGGADVVLETLRQLFVKPPENIQIK